eukprot:5179503-Heterocapsa_arctica.AAC.1
MQGAGQGDGHQSCAGRHLLRARRRLVPRARLRALRRAPHHGRPYVGRRHDRPREARGDLRHADGAPRRQVPERALRRDLAAKRVVAI